MLKNIDRTKKISFSDLLIKSICIFALLLYLYCVLYITLIDRTVGMRRHVFRPLWEVSSMFRSGNYRYWSGQIGCNIIMLMPLGFLLPVLYDRFRSIKVIAVVGFTFSVMIELTQYYTGRGLFESDDIIHNTIGAVLGCVIYLIINCISCINQDNEE